VSLSVRVMGKAWVKGGSLRQMLLLTGFVEGLHVAVGFVDQVCMLRPGFVDQAAGFECYGGVC
jgi:hypothetical protein